LQRYEFFCNFAGNFTRIYAMTKIQDLANAAKIIRNGGLVAFPTETVYGLGADATNEMASRKIYEAKGRPSDNPFIVHVYDIAEAEKVAYLCPISKKIFETFSPGPITVVVQKKSIICDTATAGLNSVGVRIPSHPVAREFLKLCGVPVAAPSANISGKLSPTTAQMVLQDLDGRIDGSVVSDDIECGLESTVVGVVNGQVKLLRTGSVSLEQLEQCLGQKVTVSDHVKADEQPTSPGQKHKHYQPEIPLSLVENVTEIQLSSERVGVMTMQNFDAPNWDIHLFQTAEDYARNLYRTMDEMTKNKCERIIAVLPPETGVGRAIRNRLQRAASS
jgi:L-threonylcarbamoyladenylate synthase